MPISLENPSVSLDGSDRSGPTPQYNPKIAESGLIKELDTVYLTPIMYLLRTVINMNGGRTMVKLRYLTFGAIGLAAALATPAFAGANLITNGSFEYSSGTTQQAPCQVGYNCSGTGNSIDGWTMDTSSTYPQPGTPPQPDTNSWYPGYTFVMDSTTAVNGNAGALTLWTSPGPEDGLNFLAQDSVYHPDAIQQTVNLVNGQEYDLNF